MKITARGWGRDMGSRTVIDIDINSAEEVPDSDNKVMMDLTKMKIGKEGVEVSWGGTFRVSKNAEYMIWLEIPREEILNLFIKTFGTSFSREKLKSLGISLSKIAPTEAEVTHAVQNMKVAELLAIITRPSSDSPNQSPTL
jgi:hypothetical protein